MATVKWMPRSEDDLAAIRHYISRDSPQRAADFVDALMHAADRLVTFPFSGTVIAEMGQEAFREILHGNYRIIYRVQGDGVSILTVHHAARRFPPERLFDQN